VKNCVLRVVSGKWGGSVNNSVNHHFCMKAFVLPSMEVLNAHSKNNIHNVNRKSQF